MKKIIIIILATLLLVGLVLSMANTTDYLIKDVIKPSTDDNSKDESNEDDEQVIDTSKYVNDFDEMVLTPNDTNTGYLTDNGKIYLPAGTCGVSEGKFYMAITPDTYDTITASGNSSASSHAVFGPQYSVKDYLCIVYDIDISVDEGYTQEFGVRPDYRTLDGSVGAPNESLIRYRNGQYVTYYGSDVLVSEVPNNYHFTYIIWADGSYDAYIDGKLIYECDSAYNDDTVYATGLRLQFKYASDVSTEQRVYFDNLQIKTFDIGYDGAINSLYENPDVDLATNIDTVLGGDY